ncbi:hypothetical protein FQZ97_1072560 [compost metagenome]
MAVELAELVAHRSDIFLLPGGVYMVTARPERGLHTYQAEVDEVSHGIAHHLGASASLGQRRDIVLTLDNLVGG